MAGSIKRFINVSTDEVYGETSLGKEIGGLQNILAHPVSVYVQARQAGDTFEMQGECKCRCLHASS